MKEETEVSKRETLGSSGSEEEEGGGEGVCHVRLTCKQ